MGCKAKVAVELALHKGARELYALSVLANRAPPVALIDVNVNRLGIHFVMNVYIGYGDGRKQAPHKFFHLLVVLKHQYLPAKRLAHARYVRALFSYCLSQLALAHNEDYFAFAYYAVAHHCTGKGLKGGNAL